MHQVAKYNCFNPKDTHFKKSALQKRPSFNKQASELGTIQRCGGQVPTNCIANNQAWKLCVNHLIKVYDASDNNKGSQKAMEYASSLFIQVKEKKKGY